MFSWAYFRSKQDQNFQAKSCHNGVISAGSKMTLLWIPNYPPRNSHKSVSLPNTKLKHQFNFGCQHQFAQSLMRGLIWWPLVTTMQPGILWSQFPFHSPAIWEMSPRSCDFRSEGRGQTTSMPAALSGHGEVQSALLLQRQQLLRHKVHSQREIHPPAASKELGT